MTTEDYVSFETAKLLKERGFDWDCKQVYDLVRPQSCADGKMYDNFPDKNPNAYSELVSAPTLQMAMKWLREVHKIEIRVIYDNERLSWYGACNPMNELSQILLGFGRKSKSYEEACEEAIRYCLKKLI